MASVRPDFGPETPWTRSNVIWSAGLTGVGVVCAAVSWNGASRKTNYDDQIGWAYAAVGSAVLCCLGVVLWVVAGLRVVRRGRRVLVREARELWARPVVATVTTVPDDLVIAARQTQYHRAPCPAVRGKQVTAVTSDEAQRAGLQPCGMCSS